MSIPAYDLIEVQIGPSRVSARPVAWDGKDYDGEGNDESGNPVHVTDYATTCPHCGQLIQTPADQLYTGIDGSINNVRCNECGVGNEPSPDAEPLVILDEEEPALDVSKPIRVGPARIFADPLLSGEFDAPVDADRLSELR